MSLSLRQLRGFTITEIIVVITIIAILASLVVVSVQNVRISARDTQRVNDINEIRSALSIYYSKYNQYPTYVTPGQQFAVNSITYLASIPSNPTPHTDNGCPDKDYSYLQTNSGLSYTLTFCLGVGLDTIPAGVNKGIPEGITP